MGGEGKAVAIKQATVPEPSLSETAYRTLREHVLTCKLSPGERLTERGTAAELGLGLSPVRHALTRLVQDGLVQVLPVKGYRVSPLTAKSVNDLFTVWLVLGPAIARLGVSHAEPDQAAELIRVLAEGDHALAGGPSLESTARFISLANEAFDLLAIAAGNDRLLQAYRSLAGEMSRVWTLVLTVAPIHGELLAVTADWRPIVDQRDGEGAERLARVFIEASHAAALRVLQSWSADGARQVVQLRR